MGANLVHIYLFFFRLIGNTIVLIVLTNSKTVSRRSPFNIYYIYALAIIDLLTSSLVIPDYVFRTDVYNPPSGHHGDVLCKLLIGGLLPFSLLAMSMYLLVAICLERRKAVLHPFSTLTPPPMYQSLLVIFMIFCLSTFNQLPTIYSIYYNKQNLTSGNFCAYKETNETAHLVFHLFAFVLEWVIPALVFLTSFVQMSRYFTKINRQLRRSTIVSTEQLLSGNSLRDPTLKRKEASISTMRSVIIVFLICVLPNEAVYMVFEFVPFVELQMNSPIFQVTVLLRYSNALINPILYIHQRSVSKKLLESL